MNTQKKSPCVLGDIQYAPAKSPHVHLCASEGDSGVSRWHTAMQNSRFTTSTHPPKKW